jgi:hypothetical protein
VVKRLCHTVEEEPSAHSTGKQHGEPRGIIVLWLAVIWPKLDVAVLAQVHNDDEDSPGILE